MLEALRQRDNYMAVGVAATNRKLFYSVAVGTVHA